MAKTYNPKGKRAPLSDKDMNTFPINLFLSIFFDFDKDKFDRTYANNIKIFFDVYKYDLGFSVLYKNMNGIGMDELSRLWSMNQVRLMDARHEAELCIRHNKDVVFSGFKSSKLRNKVITRISQELVGINRSTATALVDAGLYSVSDINYLKSGSEFITVLKESTPNPYIVGKVFTDTLVVMNRCGFDTSKFGYSGIEVKKKATPIDKPISFNKNQKVENIIGYNYAGLSDTSFKIKCPNCGRFFRIHINGHINDDGKLEIEHTIHTDNDVWNCENCMQSVRIDKVSKFLKNYMS